MEWQTMMIRLKNLRKKNQKQRQSTDLKMVGFVQISQHFEYQAQAQLAMI